MRSHNLEETTKIAGDFLASLSRSEAGATVVALHGDLGSGKTTFVQQLAQLLGITERVISPTFIIEKFYSLPRAESRGFKQLVHLDCYRIEHSSEMTKLNWAEIIADPGNLIVVEWAEKIADILPPNHRQLKFTFINETEREIEF